ncbi:hypothetical protein KA005_70860 [bacterium]|nr:hypothetical protein [bacterium]
MTKFLTYFILGLFCVFSLTSFADAQDSESFMITIYNGLANIIEANMNNPGQCSAAIESFCRKHKAEIDRLSAISQRKRQEAMQQDYSAEDLSMEKMQRQFDAMAQSKSFQAVNRFTQAVQNFCMQNPDYSEELGDAIERGFPQPKPKMDY